MRVQKARLGSNPSHSASKNPVLWWRGFLIGSEHILVLTVKSDVVVVGGGLEGTLLARSLHRSGQRVVLLEAGRPRDGETPYDEWICSPFLYSAPLWSWIRNAQTFWLEEGCLGHRDGAALAPRESPSWLRLLQIQESHGLTATPLPAGLFPEFRRDSSLGSLFMEKLPCLRLQGLVSRLWHELQREGVDPYADTPVRQIDWEHEWPTAVTRDTIFRARRLVLCAGRQTPKLLGQSLPDLCQRHLWLEGRPGLEDRRPQERPVLWIHYAKAPVYLCPGPERWGWTRLWPHPDEAAEKKFLEEIPERWLSCSVEERAFYDLRVAGLADGQPALDYHAWRQDCVWLAGLGQTHWPWLPELIGQLTDPQWALTDELSARRLAEEAVTARA